MSEYPNEISIADYKSAAGAAKRVHNYIKTYAGAMDDNKSDVILKRPENYRRDCWAVVWESGPLGWAYSLLSGESISGEEFAKYGRGKSEIKGLLNHNHIDIECGNKYTIEFRNR